MAHGKKLPSGKFRAVLTDRAARKRLYILLPSTIRTKRAADQAARQLQDDLDAGSLGLRQSPSERGKGWLTVSSEIVADTEIIRPGSGWTENLQQYQTRFALAVGDVPAAHVRTEQCREYVVARLQDGAAPSTVRKEVAYLRRVFNRAIEQGVLARNPWAGVKAPPEPKHPPRFLSQAEALALLRAAPTERAFRYLFLLATGVRRSEAWSAIWQDVDFAAGILLVRNAAKGAGPRYPFRRIPVGKTLLEELRARQGERFAKIFAGHNNWLRDLRVDLKAAGVSADFRIHDLRHTFGSWLAQAGHSLHEIRDWMGHASVTTTERYAHLLPDPSSRMAETFAGLGAYLGHAGQIVDMSGGK